MRIYLGRTDSKVIFYTLTTLVVLITFFDPIRFLIKHKFQDHRLVHTLTDNYFTKLGQLDRLRWLVLEAHMRKNYGVKMIDD